MNAGDAGELRRRYLLSLYEHSGGDINQGVNEDELLAELGISEDEGNRIFSYLSAKRLIRGFTFGHIAITDYGMDEVERIMAETYAEKMMCVLRKIYDLGGPSHKEWVDISDLLKEFKVKPRDLYQILNDLEHRKGLIGSVDQAVWMVPAGLELIESGGQQVTPMTGITFTTNIHGDNYGGVQQGGQDNTQTNIVIGSDFEQAIRRLLAGIEQSQSLIPLQKIRVRGDVQAVNDLARVEKTPEVVEEANTRIASIQAVLSTTADLVSLGIVVIPILRAAFGG